MVAACQERNLELPRLLCEPGRSLVAPAGVTLYTVGSRKHIPNLNTYVAVDGGMSDNPRPITYQSEYTACLADRPGAEATETVTLVGKHCESGDVLLKRLPWQLPNLAMCWWCWPPVLTTPRWPRITTASPNLLLCWWLMDGLVQRRERPDELLRYDVRAPAIGRVIRAKKGSAVLWLRMLLDLFCAGALGYLLLGRVSEPHPLVVARLSAVGGPWLVAAALRNLPLTAS